MKIKYGLVCLFIFGLQYVYAQQPKYQVGIRTGNHFSFAEFEDSDILKNQALLRYSAGILVRIKLKDHYRGRPLPWVPMVRDGVFALDLGLNVVFKGYDYQVNALKNYQNQLSLELPLLITFWDAKDIFISRKWKRKKLTTFARMGLKPAFLLKRNIEEHVQNTEDSVIEEAEIGGFNLFSMVTFGIIKQRKNGGSMAVELSGNAGMFQTTKGTIDYENLKTGKTLEHRFSSHGHYISVNVLYFFGERTIGKEIIPPVIYSPRF